MIARPEHTLAAFRNYTFIHPIDSLGTLRVCRVLVLVEELRRHAVEIVFTQMYVPSACRRPRRTLLLQMQGMFAEYERAKIMERCRRGKRHAASRASVNVLRGAPYGYRYITKHAGGGSAAYEIVPEQAAIVRQIFDWVGRDRLSIGEVARRLKRQGTPSSTGKAWWDRTSVWGMLKNPADMGHAAFGKTHRGASIAAQAAPRAGQDPTPVVLDLRHERSRSSVDSRRGGWSAKNCLPSCRNN